FLSEIKRETLFKLQHDEDYQRLVLKIQTNPFLFQDWQKYKARILQLVQRNSCNEFNIQEEPSITVFNGTTKRKVDNTSNSSSFKQGTPKKSKSNGQRNPELSDPNKRQTRIIKRLRKLTYGTVQKSPEESLISIRDPLYAYLSMCPSFVKPPLISGSDYTKEFFEETLIPRLKMEAEQLRTSNVPPPPYLLDTQGAMELGFGSVPIFGCLLCTSITPCTFKKMKQHARTFHKIDANPERVISVNSLALEAQDL
ncbi:12920_t:CDS:2, partial [Cetraspora pellucida]